MPGLAMPTYLHCRAQLLMFYAAANVCESLSIENGLVDYNYNNGTSPIDTSANASVTTKKNSESANVPLHTVARFRCNSGFKLSGSFDRTCRNGKWTRDTNPTCDKCKLDLVQDLAWSLAMYDLSS